MQPWAMQGVLHPGICVGLLHPQGTQLPWRPTVDGNAMAALPEVGRECLHHLPCRGGLRGPAMQGGEEDQVPCKGGRRIKCRA